MLALSMPFSFCCCHKLGNRVADTLYFGTEFSSCTGIHTNSVMVSGAGVQQRLGVWSCSLMLFWNLFFLSSNELGLVSQTLRILKNFGYLHADLSGAIKCCYSAKELGVTVFTSCSHQFYFSLPYYHLKFCRLEGKHTLGCFSILPLFWKVLRCVCIVLFSGIFLPQCVVCM